MAYDGSVTFETAMDTSGFTDGTGDINKQFQTIRKGAEAAASGLEKVPAKLDQTVSSASRLSDIVKGGGALKLIEKGVDAVTASLDSAISRYDTMKRDAGGVRGVFGKNQGADRPPAGIACGSRR